MSAPESPPTAEAPGIPRLLLTGAAMGVADAVPGVSGGTIALIAGIYDRWLAAFADLLAPLRRPLAGSSWRACARGLGFLLPLYAAVGLALWVSLRVLVGHGPEVGADPAALQAALAEAPGLLINPATAPAVFALFFGLVAATVREPWCARQRAHWSDLALFILGAALAAGLALSPALGSAPTPLALLVGGAIAIAVMLLPGVSGSLALLVLGLYQPVAAGAVAFDFAVLLPFALGLVCGLALVVPLLRALLAHAHDRTMAVLAGLMAGSLVALWPWKTHYYPKAIALLGPMLPSAPQGSWWWALIAAAVGAALVPVLRWLAVRVARASTAPLR
ncbi:MAG: DUF368 domain-containing protein [Planctomycetota bacterium]|nr:DUF368 domain-containing protein [Planctomycetota bacterium]